MFFSKVETTCLKTVGIDCRNVRHIGSETEIKIKQENGSCYSQNTKLRHV